MARTTQLAALLLPLSLAACSSQPIPINPLVLYDKKEEVKLSYCADLANSTYYVARMKQSGTSEQDAIKRYAIGPSAKIRFTLIEDVYANDINDSWQYASNLFQQCAQKVANVDASRLNIASLCAQKTILAGSAYEDRSQGKLKFDAYTRFAAYKSIKPYDVVDWVYSLEDDDTLEYVIDTTWHRCIRVVAE